MERTMHRSQTSSWIENLENMIQKENMLLHPFYQAWTCGMLSKSTLQDYAKEYYHHVKAFPTYISALHSRCEDQEIRKELLTNLIDEEAGCPNHPDLWRQFTKALGVSDAEIEMHEPSAATTNMIAEFRKNCTEGPIGVGIAALYCYESQIPEICKTKVDGLEKWYGMTNPEEYRYFSVHEEADVEHSQAEKRMLLKLVSSDEEAQVLDGAKNTLTSLNNFLSSFL